MFAQSSPSGSGNNNGGRLEGPLKVRLQTSMGNITLQLRDDKPITSGNFRSLVASGLYDGTIFHRVTDFLIQGGNVNTTVAAISDEIGANNTNSRGTVAMAKSAPNTATTGFFINIKDNSNSLPYDEYLEDGKASSGADVTYSVFGYVIEGMDVVDAIAQVEVDNPDGVSPRPLQDVVLIKAEILP